MTEFEEDGRASPSSVSVSVSVSVSPEGQIWRPPSAVAPPSAAAAAAAAAAAPAPATTTTTTTTYYVADKHGNWVLGDSNSNHNRISQTAELVDWTATPFSPHPQPAATALPIHQPISSSSGQRRRQRQQQQTKTIRLVSESPPQLPPRLPDAAHHDAIIPRPLFSSSFSSSSSSPPFHPGHGPPARAPAPASSRHPHHRHRPSPPGSRQRRRSPTRPRAPSLDSGITTFAVSSPDSSSDEEHAPPNILHHQHHQHHHLQPVHLSPVAESPWQASRAGAGSPTDRWPVLYPPIPGREPPPAKTTSFHHAPVPRNAPPTLRL
ncbi:hypothetical protein E4U41_005418, partial [Claviceps citrina]